MAIISQLGWKIRLLLHTELRDKEIAFILHIDSVKCSDTRFDVVMQIIQTEKNEQAKQFKNEQKVFVIGSCCQRIDALHHL